METLLGKLGKLGNKKLNPKLLYFYKIKSVRYWCFAEQHKQMFKINNNDQNLVITQL